VGEYGGADKVIKEKTDARTLWAWAEAQTGMEG
jgi:hypothetical protein